VPHDQSSRRRDLSWARAVRAATVALLLTLTSCHHPIRPVDTTDPTPPNTILLSQMLGDLSAQPGFTEAFLREIQGANGKRGAAILTPALIDHLRDLILGKDWHGLDHFPGWTMAAINPTIGVVTHIASPDKSSLLDVGSYQLSKDHIFADLGGPPASSSFETDEPTSNVGYGVTRGDGLGPLATEHAQSQRLANVLNRLSANGVDGVQRFGVTSPWISMDRIGIEYPHPKREGPPVVFKMIAAYYAPEDLIEALQQTGHQITVTDSRYFANFGHLHYKGQDVMMPFYINSQIIIPGTKRPLLVPVAHAEYEWHIRGPLVNADVSFYFGIDGKAEFRTMDSLDQAWVMKRDAHTYTGADAVEVTRLTAAMIRAYMRLHKAHPELPFGGYYTLGVCQDVVAAIELKLTGKATLFPNTAEDRYFTDPADAEINALIRRLPKDRSGHPPQPERVFASLPVGSTKAELASITIPGLAADLIAVHDAWTDGTLQRSRRRWPIYAAIAALLLGGAAFAFLRRRA